MKKTAKLTKFGCIVLSVLMLAQVVPINLWNLFGMTAAAAETIDRTTNIETETKVLTDHYQYEIPVEHASFYHADIPPTIIENPYEKETDSNTVIEYHDDKVKVTGIDEAVALPNHDTEAKIAEINQADITEFFRIIKNSTSYSQLSDTDALYICQQTMGTDSEYMQLEESGFSLTDSISIVRLSRKFLCDISEIQDEYLKNEIYTSILDELDLYLYLINDRFENSLSDKELRGYILKGYSCDQVLHAYGLSQALHLSIAETIDQTTDELLNDGVNFTETESVYHLDEINSDTDISDAEISDAVLTAVNSEIYQITSASSDEDLTVIKDYLTAPYLYEENTNEHISLNTGAVQYSTTDYTLPGRNGLDLVIGRIYSSADSNDYNPALEATTAGTPVYVLVEMVKAARYVEETNFWLSDKIEYNDIAYYSTREAAQAQADDYNKLNLRTESSNGDGTKTVVTYTYSVSSRLMDTYTVYSSTRNANNTLKNMWGLGYGWAFSFPFISFINTNPYLHLGDGTIYKVDNIAPYAANGLRDYSVNDMIFNISDTSYTNGSEKSQYSLTYQNGTVYYFGENGALMAIVNRYGDAITFTKTTQNGYPHYTIVDTLGRTTVISGEKTDSGYDITVHLPNDDTIVYHGSSYYNALSSYINADGEKTNYSYTTQTAYFNAASKNTDASSYTYTNLTTITHPTGAQTKFSYEKTQRNFGYRGLTDAYRIHSRWDLVNGDTCNVKTYTYSTDDYTGYPTNTDPDVLPSTFTYHTTVTDVQGLSTTYTFDKKNLQTSSVSKNGNTKLQETAYVYNADKLPTQTTVKQYSSSNQTTPLTTVTAAEYDSKGNITAGWSSMANGNTGNTEYKTTYTYDSAYGMLLTKTYKTDANTTVKVQNTLDSTKKNILCTEVFQNNTRKSRTEYTYDQSGNVLTEKRYHDNFTDYDLIEYTYQNRAYLTEEKHSGVLGADGTAAASTPGYGSGIIATRYAYDTLGRMTSRIDANGNTTAYAYDALGNVTKVTNPDGTSVTYTRSYTENYVIVTDENGAKVKYTYTPLGLEYETIDVQTGSVMTRKEYDSASRLTKESEYLYGGVTVYTYDVLGRITSAKSMQDTTVLAETTYAYDDAADNGTYRKVTKTVTGDSAAPSEVTTEYTDKHGNLIKTGRVLGSTEYVDTNTYDYVGNVIKQVSAKDAQKGLDFSVKTEYHISGQAAKIYNAQNQYVTNTYDALGRLVTATDYAGTPTTYSYDALGRLLSQTVTVEAGKTAKTKYEYDANGNITAEYKPIHAVGSTEAFGKTVYTYNSRNRLTGVKQYDGTAVVLESSYTYDSVGNMLTSTSGGKTTTYTYDRFGNVLTEKDALGKTETYHRGTLGKLTSKVDRRGVTTTYSYDALGRTTAVTADSDTVRYTYTKTGKTASEQNGWQKTQYTYDSFGRMVKAVETELQSYAHTPGTGGGTGGGDDGDEGDEGGDEPPPPSSAIIITFDPNGGSVSPSYVEVGKSYYLTLPTPTRTGYTFNGWYVGSTKRSSFSAYSIKESCVAVARWTANPYSVVFHGNGGTTADNAETATQSCTYDESFVLNTNTFVRSGYTFAGWSTAADGDVVYIDGEGPLVNLTSVKNGTVDLYAVWTENGTGTGGGDSTQTYTVTFDANGGYVYPSTKTVTAGGTYALPTPTKTGHTFQGWYLGETRIANGDTVAITADSTLTAHWTPITYTVTYSANGGTLKAGKTIPTQNCTYDVEFTLAEELFERAGYTFKGWSRTSYSYGSWGSYGLMAAGSTQKNLGMTANASVTLYAMWEQNASAASAAMTDSLPDGSMAEIQAVSDSGTVELLSYTKTYAYDLAGNRTGFTLKKGETTVQAITYTYSDLNRLLTVSENGKTKATYTYDTNGNRASLTYDNGVTTTYGYNLANWVTSLTNKKGSTSLSSFTYTYFASGSQKTETNNAGTVTTYAYDGLGRLKTESETGGLTVNYTYDAAGNRSKMTVSGTEAYTATYTYDNGNRLTKESRLQNNGNVTTTYTYDNNGNTVSKSVNGVTTTYSYNNFNQQTSVTSDGKTAQYAYNTQGIRTVKAVDGAVTKFYLDGGNVVAEVKNSQTTNYIRGINLICTSESYYLYSGRGDVINLISTLGVVEKTYSYDAFGDEKNSSEDDDNPFRYCGEYYDTETGTYYLRARYYDPLTGRFCSADSDKGDINKPLSLNLYTYCLNNPILYCDPTGYGPILKMLLHEGERRLNNILNLFNKTTADFSGFLLMMNEDSSGVYHASVDCWQQFGGYNDLYDWVFKEATSALPAKYEFEYNGEDLILWAWKGDYISLGAGAELGIYRRMVIDGLATEHWLVDKELALPMTLSLKDCYGNIIVDNYAPDEKQWWITGFNPAYKNVLAKELTAIYTVDFSGNIEMFKAFYNKYRKKPEWTFDKEKHIAALTF